MEWVGATFFIDEKNKYFNSGAFSGNARINGMFWFLEEGDTYNRTFYLRSDRRGSIILGDELFLTKDGKLAVPEFSYNDHTVIHISPDGKKALAVNWFDEDGKDILVTECHDKIIEIKEAPYPDWKGQYLEASIEENCIAIVYSSSEDIPTGYEPLPQEF